MAPDIQTNGNPTPPRGRASSESRPGGAAESAPSPREDRPSSVANQAAAENSAPQAAASVKWKDGVQGVDRLILAIVHSGDADGVNSALSTAGIGSTRINAQSGFLKKSNGVFVIGARNDRTNAVLEVIRRNCNANVAVEPSDDSYGVAFVLKLLPSEGT